MNMNLKYVFMFFLVSYLCTTSAMEQFRVRLTPLQLERDEPSSADAARQRFEPVPAIAPASVTMEAVHVGMRHSKSAPELIPHAHHAHQQEFGWDGSCEQRSLCCCGVLSCLITSGYVMGRVTPSGAVPGLMASGYVMWNGTPIVSGLFGPHELAPEYELMIAGAGVLGLVLPNMPTRPVDHSYFWEKFKQLSRLRRCARWNNLCKEKSE